jgi:hypothetical protein
MRVLAAAVDEVATEDVAQRHRQAAPPEQLWMGLERYWRKRAESGG